MTGPPLPLNVTLYARRNDIAVLAFQGALDHVTARHVTEAVTRLLRVTTPSMIVLDLEAVAVLDSCGIAALLTPSRRPPPKAASLS